ncbi:MAG: fatty acid desaturase [Rhizobiaceae bacterium]|nr:fatty acid desaturase [Rhizobiaceae bacterium]
MTTQFTRRLDRAVRIEWPTMALIAGCYLIWFGAGFVLWHSLPITALVILTLVVALQSSLMHEASHGHPTRNALFNELLVGLPVGLVWPYRRFKSIHLRHHADERLTDPFDDPESYYKALWQYQAMPGWLQQLLVINNTMVGRFFLGPLLSNAGFVAGDLKLLAAGDRAIWRAWLHHAAGLGFVIPILVFVFEMPFWAYLVPVYFGQSIISIRTYAEHRWSERPDGRTLIVEHTPLALLFLNNNLHYVHHKLPTAPWYALPKLFRERRDEWLKANDGYYYANYLALVRDFAFRPKQTVAHPVLRREAEPGRAFRPRVRTQNIHGLGTAPAPAKRSDD